MTELTTNGLTDDQKKFSDAVNRLIKTAEKAGDTNFVEKMQKMFQQLPTAIAFIAGALSILGSNHEELNLMLDDIDVYIETMGSAK